MTQVTLSDAEPSAGGSEATHQARETPSVADSRRARRLLIAVALIAFIPRAYIASATTYLPGDEDRGWVPLAETISLAPGSFNAPIRGDYHPALPAYGIALGRYLLGDNEIGTRGLGVLLGVATVALCFVLVRGVGGSPNSAFAAAGLLAVNEYHIQASTIATEKAYYWFFAATALFCFLRFLNSDRVKWLYCAAVAAGAAFLSKEIASLLLPIFFLTLLFTREKRHWLLRAQPYLAAALFLLCIAPDLWANAQQTTRVAGYNEYLSRITSLGFTYQPFVLYGREVFVWAFDMMGRPFYDNAKEYATGNFLLSLIIAGGVLTSLVRLRRRPEPGIRLFLVLFAFIFLFFALVGTRTTPDIDAFSFFWSDLSLLGGVLLGGYWFGTLRGWPRSAAVAVFLAGVVFSGYRVFNDRLGMERIAVHGEPDYIEHAPGTFREVAVSFNHCMLCDQRPRIELVAVRARVGREYLSDQAAAALVRGAALGTDDRSLALEASAVAPPLLKMYVLEYRVTPARGAPSSVRARVDVVHERPPWWRRRSL